MDKVVGFGSYGEVWVGKNRRSNVKVAIKKLVLAHGSTDMVAIMNEINTLINCVRFLILMKICDKSI